MSEPRRVLKQSINDVLWKVQQLEATAGDFESDHDLLHTRVTQLLEELDKLREHGASLDAKVPIELLAYIDEGGNPDSYTAEVFERANKANQLSKGKVESLQAFRDYLRNELERSGDRDRDGQGQGDGTVDQTSVPAAEEHQPARQGP